jgi:hypothetical protein
MLDGKTTVQTARRDVQTFLSSLTSAVDKMKTLCHDTLQEQAPAIEALAASHSSTLQHIQQSIEQVHGKQTEAGQALQLEVEGQLSSSRDTLSALRTSMMDSMSNLFAECEEKLVHQTGKIAIAVEKHAAIQQANAEHLHSACVTRSALAQKASEEAKIQIANSLARLEGQLEVEAASVSSAASVVADKADGQFCMVDEHLASIEAGRKDVACAVDVHMRALSSLRSERLAQHLSGNKQVEIAVQGGCESLSMTIDAHGDAVCEGLGLLGKELATQGCSAENGEERDGDQANSLSLVSAVSGLLREAEVQGQHVDGLPVHRRTRVGIDFVPDSPQDKLCAENPVARLELKTQVETLTDVTNTLYPYSSSDVSSTSGTDTTDATDVSGKPTGLKPPVRRAAQSRRPSRKPC